MLEICKIPANEEHMANTNKKLDIGNRLRCNCPHETKNNLNEY